uniref:Astacin domain-containing protein n=1 Tax=Parastrongyloides trichosuri TaxID=131310 RepID=A0A0N4Z7I5_PARTI
MNRIHFITIFFIVFLLLSLGNETLDALGLESKYFYTGSLSPEDLIKVTTFRPSVVKVGSGSDTKYTYGGQTKSSKEEIMEVVNSTYRGCEMLMAPEERGNRITYTFGNCKSTST